jgi:diguanylate cyclase (GGDEF)-like protein
MSADDSVALSRRGLLIETVNTSVATIITTASVTDALPEVLDGVSRVLPIHRAVVAENVIGADGVATPTILFKWKIGGGTDTPLSREQIEAFARDPEFREWLRPLELGIPVVKLRRTANDTVRRILTQLGVLTSLLVPIMVQGRHWGQIGFDDCESERDWADDDAKILTTLAEVIGAAITRERFLRQAQQREQLLQTMTNCAAQIATARNLDEAIARSLGVVAAALGVDRMMVMEATSSGQVGSRSVLRSHWQAPDISMPMALIVENQSHEPAPEVKAWSEPLQRGVAIEGRLSSSRGGVRKLFEHLQIQSVLVVPVMMDGEYWGHIVLDACREERVWSSSEVDVLKILADLIGAAIARERHRAELARVAHTDALTGLANRTTFSDRLRQAFAAARRGAQGFAVLYMDLDRFKEINDTFGHHVGDRLLQEVGRRLQACTREMDVISRLGGDEFAIVQVEVRHASEAGTLAEKLIKSISEPYFVDGNTLSIGLSVGISLYIRDSSSPDALLTQADQALYRVKHAGRGQYRFYSDEIDTETRAHMLLAADLRYALLRHELRIHYQPQRDLVSGKIVGLKALLRWSHPTRGILSAEDFLPVAEKIGVMSPITRWVLDEVCRQMSLWRATGIAVPVVAIDVVLAQIRTESELIRDVTDIISRWAVGPNDLELDVPEIVLTRLTAAQRETLGKLRRLGVAIAIDRFGAPFSSLEYIHAYRVNRLKMDHDVIARAEADPNGGAVLRAVLSLAHELGVEVVAEAATTDAQRQLLIGAAAHVKGRSFCYGPAVQAGEMTLMLRPEQCEATRNSVTGR